MQRVAIEKIQGKSSGKATGELCIFVRKSLRQSGEVEHFQMTLFFLMKRCFS